MKFTRRLLQPVLFAALVLLGVFPSVAAEPTALELIKEANRHVGEDVKDKVVQIRSEKSIASLTPNIWYVVFYDKDARFKTAEVKLGAGKKLDVKHPMRQPFAYMNYKNVMDVKTLKVDSDEAVRIATKEPLLGNLTIRATQLSLERKDDTPIWRVRLWAQRLRDPNKDADIGQVHISALDGSVIENDLNIKKVD